MNMFYECNLKKNATRGFLKWGEKQIKSILPAKINAVQNEIGEIYEDLNAMPLPQTI